jgi:hypothetical protein
MASGPEDLTAQVVNKDFPICPTQKQQVLHDPNPRFWRPGNAGGKELRLALPVDVNAPDHGWQEDLVYE